MDDQPIDNMSPFSVPPMQFEYWNQHLNNNVIDYRHPPLPPFHQPPPSVPLYHPMMSANPPPLPPPLPPFAPPPPNPQIQPTSVPNPQFFSSFPPPRPPTLPQEPIQPDKPYYELPAGLMVPLVKLADYEYQPLDPEQIRLPPPAPVSERLLKAVESFYAQ